MLVNKDWSFLGGFVCMGIWRKRFQEIWCTEGQSVDLIRVDFQTEVFCMHTKMLQTNGEQASKASPPTLD